MARVAKASKSTRSAPRAREPGRSPALSSADFADRRDDLRCDPFAAAAMVSCALGHERGKPGERPQGVGERDPED
jgi:hypothetical protein